MTAFLWTMIGLFGFLGFVRLLQMMLSKDSVSTNVYGGVWIVGCVSIILWASHLLP